MALRPIVINAVSKHTATVIMLHGLGDSGAGWADLAENWRYQNKFPEVKFLFPNAPSLPITANGGYIMPGWYDITSFDGLSTAHDEPGILKSRRSVLDLIESEINNTSIPTERIILGGFSQGGAISLFTGLTTKYKLAGVFGLSTYLVLGDKIAEMVKESAGANKETSFFMGHGDADMVVRYEWGSRTAGIIKDTLGHDVTFKTYPNLPHSAAPQEIVDLEQWIGKCLTKPKQEGTENSAL